MNPISFSGGSHNYVIVQAKQTPTAEVKKYVVAVIKSIYLDQQLALDTLTCIKYVLLSRDCRTYIDANPVWKLIPWSKIVDIQVPIL